MRLVGQQAPGIHLFTLPHWGLQTHAIMLFFLLLRLFYLCGFWGLSSDHSAWGGGETFTHQTISIMGNVVILKHVLIHQATRPSHPHILTQTHLPTARTWHLRTIFPLCHTFLPINNGVQRQEPDRSRSHSALCLGASGSSGLVLDSLGTRLRQC